MRLLTAVIELIRDYAIAGGVWVDSAVEATDS